MTAQFSDSLLWEGESWDILGELPLCNDPRIEDRPVTGRNTACARGYVATWGVVDDRLMLSSVKGKYALRNGQGLPATWVSTVVRAVDGVQQSYVHSGYESEYSGVVELDIVAGTVRRSRHVDGATEHRGISEHTPVWESMPEWPGLFPAWRRGDTAPGRPFDTAPVRASFHDRALRVRAARERSSKRLRPGELALSAGMTPNKGGQLAEWERGHRDLDAAKIRAVCTALGITETEVAQLRAQDGTDFDDAWAAWADTPIVPVLQVQAFGGVRYSVDRPFADRTEAENWVRQVAALTWRPMRLFLDRRNHLDVDGMGMNANWTVVSCPTA